MSSYRHPSRQPDFRQVKGRARFAVFTYQQWVGWVTEQRGAGQWNGRLTYVNEEYALAEGKP